MKWSSLYNFFKQYFVGIIICLCLLFVITISGYRLIIKNPTYVYVTVKVGQGFWWSNSVRPGVWFLDAIKKGVKENNFTGTVQSEILEVRTFPFWGSDQMDIIASIRLNVQKKRNGSFIFKRNTLAVGSPISLDFPSVSFSGTVTQLESTPITYHYLTKDLILTKKNAFPWEYDAITVGDYFSDGVDKIFEIISKRYRDTSNLTSDTYGNTSTESRRFIEVKARIKVRTIHDQLVYSTEQIIRKGKLINIATNQFVFQDFLIGDIQDAQGI